MHVYPLDDKKDNDFRTMSGIHGRVNRADIDAAAASLDLRVLDRIVQVGDLFLAGRNTGIKLLTAKTVEARHFVTSVEGAYPYDTWECYPVEDISTKTTKPIKG